MTQKSVARRITGEIADATGTSDAEVRLALTGAAVVAVSAAGLLAALRVAKVLADLGTDVFNHPKRDIRVPQPRATHDDAAARLPG
jgi:hypothetical protein